MTLRQLIEEICFPFLTCILSNSIPSSLKVCTSVSIQEDIHNLHFVAKCQVPNFILTGFWELDTPERCLLPVQLLQWSSSMHQRRFLYHSIHDNQHWPDKPHHPHCLWMEPVDEHGHPSYWRCRHREYGKGSYSLQHLPHPFSDWMQGGNNEGDSSSHWTSIGVQHCDWVGMPQRRQRWRLQRLRDTCVLLVHRNWWVEYGDVDQLIMIGGCDGCWVLWLRCLIFTIQSIFKHSFYFAIVPGDKQSSVALVARGSLMHVFFLPIFAHLHQTHITLIRQTVSCLPTTSKKSSRLWTKKQVSMNLHKC